MKGTAIQGSGLGGALEGGGQAAGRPADCARCRAPVVRGKSGERGVRKPHGSNSGDSEDSDYTASSKRSTSGSSDGSGSEDEVELDGDSGSE